MWTGTHHENTFGTRITLPVSSANKKPAKSWFAAGNKTKQRNKPKSAKLFRVVVFSSLGKYASAYGFHVRLVYKSKILLVTNFGRWKHDTAALTTTAMTVSAVSMSISCHVLK